jgi:hypothetical protein
MSAASVSSGMVTARGRESTVDEQRHVNSVDARVCGSEKNSGFDYHVSGEGLP